MPIELSPHNARVEAVQRLRTTRGRDAVGRFAAEGPTLLAEAARSGVRPIEMFATATGVLAFDPGAYEAAGTPVYVLPDRAFARLSDLDSPTGVLAVYAIPAQALDDVLARPGPVLLLAGVNDPGNAGTLVRSAEAFGAAGVVFGAGGAEPYAPKVVRASMGSVFRVPVIRAAAAEIVAAGLASGRTIVAADVHGDDLRTAVLPARAIFAVGNERRGVRDWLAHWDRSVRIPQRDATESLNAAVAGSILLYESQRVK